LPASVARAQQSRHWQTSCHSHSAPFNHGERSFRPCCSQAGASHTFSISLGGRKSQGVQVLAVTHMFIIAPSGQVRIAPRCIAGMRWPSSGGVPSGRLNAQSTFIRPYGTWAVGKRRAPSDKSLGYRQMSLRGTISDTWMGFRNSNCLPCSEAVVLGEFALCPTATRTKLAPCVRTLYGNNCVFRPKTRVGALKTR
jgi:hypothetical protein